jgi:hypothetical protein
LLVTHCVDEIVTVHVCGWATGGFVTIEGRAFTYCILCGCMDGTAESELGEEDERTTADLIGDESDTLGMDRWTATKYIAPFVFIGLFDLALLLGWGLDPLWGFMILPPILFVSVLGWIAFRTGFASDR